MSNPNRLYFGNLGFDKVDDDVREIFKDCGEIIDIHIIRDRFTKRSQGYGFITFGTPESKESGLKLNGKEFFGRVLKVNLETKSQEKKRLFIKGIPTDKTEDDVKSLFAQYGTVENFFFIKDHTTGASRGFGFLDFSNAEEAQAGIAMNGQEAFGGTLIVKLAEDKPARGGNSRGGGRGGFGRGYGYGGYGRGGYGGYGQAPYGGGGWGQQQQSWGGGYQPYGGGTQPGWQQGGYGGNYGRGGGWNNQQGGYGGQQNGAY